MIGFIERKITLELCGTGVQARVRARQGDSLVHKIIVDFTRYGRACFPDGAVMAEVRGTLPTGKVISGDAIIENGKRCVFIPGTEFFGCGGSVICSLILRGDDGGELCSPAFAIDAEPSSATVDEVADAELYSRIAELLSEVMAEKKSLGEDLFERFSELEESINEKLSDIIVVDGTKTAVDTRDHCVVYDTKTGKYVKIQWTVIRQVIRSFIDGNVTATAVADSQTGYKATLPELEDDGVLALTSDIADAIKDCVLKSEINHWRGKKWYAYGTSLTSTAQGKYAPYVAELGGMTLTNKGIPGGGIVTNTNIKNAVMNTTDGKTEADLITLEVGANDTAARLGTIYDTGDDTFCGALNQCIRYLQENTDAQIVVMSSTNSNTREPGYEYTEPESGKSIVNAFNPDDPDILTGQYIKNGVATTSTTFNESGFISIGGSRMYIYFPTTNQFYTSLNACFYNENKEYIGYRELLSTDYYTIPDGAVYVRVPFKPANLRVQMVFFADEGDEITVPETAYDYAGYNETIFTIGGDGVKTHTKLDQWKAIRDVCMVNSVPYIPMGEEGGLGYARLTLSGKYLVDSIHHTSLGGYNLAQFVWSRLKNIPLWYSQM